MAANTQSYFREGDWAVGASSGIRGSLHSNNSLAVDEARRDIRTAYLFSYQEPNCWFLLNADNNKWSTYASAAYFHIWHKGDE